MAEKSNNGEVTFEIKEFIGALDTANDNGWRRELNLVSWNGPRNHIVKNSSNFFIKYKFFFFF